MIQPPGSIEQLNNFRDSIQSPDGLDRLRAMQYVQASSQGLSGMPQVTAPVPQMQPQVPMINKAYGGEVGTGGLIGKTDNGTSIWSKTNEGILNRGIYGGIFEGDSTSTPTPTATTTSSNSLDAPGTLSSGIAGPTNFTIEDGMADQYGNTIGDFSGTKDYYDLNYAAKDAGQKTFMYGGKLMSVDPGFLRGMSTEGKNFISNATPYAGYIPGSGASGQVSIGDYQEAPYLPTAGFNQDISRDYDSYYDANQAAQEAGSPTFMWGNKFAQTDPGLLSNYDYANEGPKPFYSNKVPEQLIDYANTLIQGQSVHNAPRPDGFGADAPQKYYMGTGVYSDTPPVEQSGRAVGSATGSATGGKKHGGQITARAYGGEIGTGGLVSITEDGTQVFDNSQEGALNRATHGGVLEGYNYTPSTGGTATATAASTPVTTNSLDAPGTLASGTTAPSGFTIEDGMADQYGNTIGDFSGTKDYYDLNYAALDAGQKTFMYGGKLMSVDPGFLRGMSTEGKNFISNKVPEGARHVPGYGGGYYTTTPLEQDGSGLGGYGSTSPVVHGSGLGGYGNYKHGGQITAREGGGQVDPSQAAQGLASFGRYGDNILVHMNPEELDGLASLGNITYNPVTGLPEAFSFGKIFKGLRKLAPIILAVAAPYAFGATTALGIGASTAAGSFFGNMIAGAKPGDALKAGLMSGLFAGGGAYMGGASSGFGGAASAGNIAGGVAGTAGNVGPGAMGAGGFGQATQSAGSSILSAGTGGIPSAMGAGGFGQAVGAGGTLAAPVASQFTNVANVAGRPSYGGTVQQQLQLAPKVNPQVYGGTPAPNVIAGPGGMGSVDGQFVNPDLGNPMVPGGRDIAPVQQNLYSNARIDGAGQMVAGPDGSYAQMNPSIDGVPGTSQATKVAPSLFEDSSMGNFKRIGNEIYDKYSTPTGIAKLIAMDSSTPDWEAQYAAEAAAKNQQLTDAGYTVETGFDGQTVIRDSSGVVQPRNLTVQDILDRALGKQKRTNLVERYDYAPTASKEGGLVSLKQGGEFSGMVPGNGHGMEDNVYMPIVEKGQGSQVGTLAVSPSEYVVDSYTMAALGNGNADAGAKVMDNVVKGVRKKAYGNMKQPNEINGLSALQPMMERANI
jgi:hypothetical protein